MSGFERAERGAVDRSGAGTTSAPSTAGKRTLTERLEAPAAESLAGGGGTEGGQLEKAGGAPTVGAGANDCVPRSVVIAAILMIASACARENLPPGDKKMWFRLTAQELGRALDLAERTVIANGAVLAELKLTSAVNMMAGREYRGPAYSRLTFKRRDLIPKDTTSELGAGGEIFVDVDLDANIAKIAGHGE